MTLPIYPDLPGKTPTPKWTPRFYNMAPQTTATGADIDLGLAEYPLHDFEFQYEVLRQGAPLYEFETLFGFVLQIGGNKGRFLYSNPIDRQVTGQPIGTGDGTTTTFSLIRSFGAGGFAGVEPVGMVDTGATFNVKVAGVLKTLGSDYTRDLTTPADCSITFASPPAAAAAITVDMTYYYYCKFPDDAQEFDRIVASLWSSPKVILHSCRPGA